MNQETISGIVSDLKVIPTRTGKNMVTFVLGGKSFKAFGDIAAVLQALNAKQVEITAKCGTYRGKPEYAVVSLKGTVDGRDVSVSDGRTISAPQQQNLKHNDRHRWNLQSYTNPQNREVGVWLNAFFDSLTEEEWLQWRTHRDSFWPKTDTENEKIKQIDEEIECAEEINRAEQKQHLPYNSQLASQILELWSKRNRVVAGGGSLESVQARFNPRLQIVREELKRKAAAPPAEFSAKSISAELPASIAAEVPPTAPADLPRALAPLPADDFVCVEGVTSEDLENQYKSVMAAREMEKLNQSRRQEIEGSQVP